MNRINAVAKVSFLQRLSIFARALCPIIMALKSFVYVSEVDNLSDARFAAGMGVDLVGFKLDPNHENALNKAKFDEISEWIAGVKIVGEFGNTPPDQLTELLDAYKLDYLLIENEELIPKVRKQVNEMMGEFPMFRS